MRSGRVVARRSHAVDGGPTVRLADVILRRVAGRWPAVGHGALVGGAVVGGAVVGVAAVGIMVVAAVAGCSAASNTRPGPSGSAPTSGAHPTPTRTPTPAARVNRPSPTGSSRPSSSRPRASQHPSRPTRTTPPVPPTATGRVSGTTIALNPGHNGGDVGHAAELARLVPSGFGQHRACDTTGTNTDAGYPEHAFTWDVTMRVRRILDAHGVRVILTRPNDTGVGPCIDTRARTANAPGVAAVISIHADGGPAGGHGFHICEDSREPAGPVIAAASHRLTTVLHDALVRGSGLTTSTYIGHDGYYPRSDLAGLNLATVPATFIELGNMRNAADAARQSSSAGRARMAAAVAAGILDWLATR